MITVVNMNNREGNNIIPVDRTTPLGNPFHIGQDGTRIGVIEKYRQWLWEEMNDPFSTTLDQLQNLLSILKTEGSLVLGCHCKPLACHADVIKSALEWMDT